ncbi:growth/differentiation factor 8-like [Biomphalaria glabrata]|uniref:Growth/differentiation factor 8-like n=1 Tax=Biomphalaria glabrata TaxID=6526 RepID=A0A9W3AC82_BIOGL|nr:growth/differentiation factor 8-like [Biomphalaria glabrata]XP_013088433.2 growth/differentiation factor 8-like [Biomphalaria glabrata]XP_055884783.1 growth/differentiation factor 8-like [Biomphalaria glabrata]XP_055884784.1 growth/differentiation factor 8-like [Biomphalaria glabrata]KAI8773717.1 growth/differentiation factor 8 [Biomphalaria glabrata]
MIKNMKQYNKICMLFWCVVHVTGSTLPRQQGKWIVDTKEAHFIISLNSTSEIETSAKEGKTQEPVVFNVDNNQTSVVVQKNLHLENKTQWFMQKHNLSFQETVRQKDIAVEDTLSKSWGPLTRLVESVSNRGETEKTLPESYNIPYSKNSTDIASNNTLPSLHLAPKQSISQQNNHILLENIFVNSSLESVNSSSQISTLNPNESSTEDTFRTEEPHPLGIKAPNLSSIGDNTKNCTTCGGQGLPEETVKELRLNMFAALLRQKLHMPDRPDSEVVPTAPAMSTDLLHRIFQKEQLKDEIDGFYAVDDEVILPGYQRGDVCDDCFQFDLQNQVSGDISAAHLWFNLHFYGPEGNIPLVLLYEIELHQGKTFRKRIYFKRSDLQYKSEWATIDLTMPVKKWIGEGANKKLLSIMCKNCASSEVKSEQKPVLEVKYLKTNVEQRKKKNAECDPRSTCCKRPLEVNFSAINMHHIVVPASLSVDYCYGYCDGVDKYTYNHTLLKQRYRWVYLPNHSSHNHSLREQLKPCCVPLVLKTSRVMISENNVTKMELLPNVIVERCGCL